MKNRKMNRRSLAGLGVGLVVVGVAIAAALAAAERAAPARAVYHSPMDVAYSPDGKLIAATDRTEGSVALLEAGGRLVRKAAGLSKPGMVAWSGDSTKVYVSEYGKGAVVEIGVGDGKVLRRFAVGPRPMGVAVAGKRQLLLAANSALGDVSVIDLATGKEKGRVKMVREPFWIAISPDESVAVVSNLLPLGAATDAQLTAAVSLIDLEKLEKVADVKLPPNTACIRQVAISPDGKWAYAVHTVGRTTLPATQLDRGWVNTNALSVIDLKKRELYVTVLMDNLAEGAADPWGMVLSKDGGTAYITLAGTHQLATVDVGNLHRLLAGEATTKASGKMPSSPNVWTEIKADASKRANLVNDLSALYIADLINRTALPGKGPRGVSLSGDGKQLAVGQYFTGDVVMVDVGTGRAVSATPLGVQPAMDSVRKGESIFHDAHYTFQHWLSCATCHPNEARVDGLNWDLPNDGIGNPKSAKSLLQSHLTPPAMWRGIRDTMETAATAGFRFAMQVPDPKDILDVQAYLRSLEPEASPYLADGQLSEKAKRGKLVFESEKTKCVSCHSGAQHTNGKLYNVGTQGEFDPAEHTDFDTPTLTELWRTGPYLHDGRAASLQEAMMKFNGKDLHGVTSHLSKEQVEELMEYLLSL
jgi:DNA-binding beta-propeller fold protein YncE